MHKKIIIQLFLLLTLVTITTFVFFFYFKEKEILKENNIQMQKITELKINEETASLMKNMNYSFSDLNGNNYEILSEFGKVDINDPDKIFMTNVLATIHLKNESPIKIVSKFANYNKNDHETKFFENVKIMYKIHKVTSQNLNLSFKSNLVTMYNKIIYTKPGTKLFADQLQIDLLTKNSKIFMNNKFEKIKIINKK
tara:strand:- start:1351 stop:1941 length:591 start_codon:yes stop_codon:yes gene_type:complete